MAFVQSGDSGVPSPGTISQDPLAALIAGELTGADLDLPVLPSIASEVLGSSLSDQSDAARLATLIQQDQSLAGHVLRVVNSPAFRGATEIVALKQAIARLGLDRIREIALAASLGGKLFDSGAYQSIADRNWKLALAAGLWAKEVARACRKNVEIAYLCGLLHNIGVPLVLQLIMTHSEDVLEAARLDQLLSAESSLAGSVLAREWKLPDAVAATTEFLRVPENAGKHSNMVSIANAGVYIAELMLDAGLDLDQVVGLKSIQELNLYPEDVETLLACEEQIRQAMEAMQG